MIKEAIGIGTVAIVLVLVLWIGAAVYTEIPLSTATIANESLNISTNQSWVQLAYTGIKGNTQTVRNATLSTATNATDYVMNYTDGRIRGQNTTTLPENTIAYIAYTYAYRPTSQSSTFTHMNTGITLLGVGLIVAAALVILGMVLKLVGKRGSGGW